MACITVRDVEEAHGRIADQIHRTPVLTCSTFDRRTGLQLFFKAEALQKGGSFKLRGAMNAVRQLPADTWVVVTHSSGNHGQALALAASLTGRHARIVVPNTAPACKLAAMKEYGAELIMCAPAEREATSARVLAETPGAAMIPPYNHAHVIAGQGTTALELLEQVADLDAIIIPVGGGGLISGMAVAAKGRNPRIKIFGAEPAAADDAARSKAASQLVPLPGPPATIADGLKTSLGDLTWPIVRDYVDAIITVSEEEIVAGMRAVWERMKICIEPSAGVPAAVALSARFREVAGAEVRRVGVVLCGGNQDLDAIPWMVKH